MRKKARGKMGATTVALTVLFILGAQSAFADYAPSANDVVGVGSDTVQYAMDFIADGFPSGATGYNSLGNLNRIVNIDATADANARLAYSADGIGTGQCAPGTGGLAGTGNQTTTHANAPCLLNPSVILQAGLAPVLRPNGSGAGFDAMRREIDRVPALHFIDFVRSSAAQGAAGKNVADLVSVQIATDPLAILKSSTPVSNAVPLSAAMLKSIYEANTPSCKTWNDPAIGGAGASPNTIIPIVPQIGSGTRSSFLSSIGVTTVGNCALTFEENDPLAIFETSSPADTIEPMSGGRLKMFLGQDGSGGSNGYGPYFNDPSCPYAATTPAACVMTASLAQNPLAPAVTLVTTGTPLTGTLYGISRPLYLYFRQSDIDSVTPFQPGTKNNWVRTLFYNPCPNPNNPLPCVTIGGVTYGPGGLPYVKGDGAALISLAGFTPAYNVLIPGA